MRRRIYIIPKSMKVEDAIDDARAANCPEIVHGIPPVLEGIINEASLPMVYEEVEPRKVYRYEVFTTEFTHPKRDSQIRTNSEILEFNEELTEDEISDLEARLGKYVRKI